ncbi:hypothetical protein SASPL_125578 [Salvia splendens]|uniref:Template-activating factor I n=1 Tax=Salvia splendens TaxID=180675 RepID=A0A8X8XHW2_SALSN|nr:hypothetical protein SASPL_125578 [Salvia splendens]
MGADKGKKPKLGGADNENNGTEQIDAELVLSIEKLQEFQDELDKVNEEASEKVLELEQKYNEIRKPVYDKRNDIIKSIPDFWLTAFMSHPALSELLTDEDQKIFKYLSKLEVEDCKDVKSGYSITFHFESNPYFEDAILTKTFTFFEEGTTEISATAITWKEGMGIPIGVAAEEKKGNKRPKADERLLKLSRMIYGPIPLDILTTYSLLPDFFFLADEEGSEMDDDEVRKCPIQLASSGGGSVDKL